MHVSQISIIRSHQISVGRIGIQRSIVKFFGQFLIVLFVVKNAHFIINHIQKRPVFTVIDQFVVGCHESILIPVLIIKQLRFFGISLDNHFPFGFSVHVYHGLIAVNGAVPYSQFLVQLAKNKAVSSSFGIYFCEFFGHFQFGNGAVFFFQVQKRLGQNRIGIGNNLVFKLFFVQKLADVFDDLGIVTQTHVGFFSPNLGLINLVAGGIFVQNIVEGVQSGDKSLVVIP